MSFDLNFLQSEMRRLITADVLSLEDIVRTQKFVIDAEPLDLQERLEVYRYAWFARIFESLQEDFARVEKVLGKDIFEEVVREYLKENPSNSHTLVHLGEKFPEFLKKHPVLDGRGWLVELAYLELAELQLVFVQDFVPGLDLSRLGELSEQEQENLKLEFHPGWMLFSLEHSVLDYFQENSTQVSKGPEFIVGFRDGFHAEFKAVSADEFNALSKLRKPGGTSLGEWVTSDPDSLLWLGKWVEQSWVSVSLS